MDTKSPTIYLFPTAMPCAAYCVHLLGAYKSWVYILMSWKTVSYPEKCPDNVCVWYYYPHISSTS
jgi:hypothetical protein